MKIFINGRFLSQPTTGVQRFARQVLMELDSLATASDDTRGLEFVLVVPSDCLTEVPTLKGIEVLITKGRASHLWEQVSLVLCVRGGFLLNLAGSAPILKRNQLFMAFDAAVFDQPDSYSHLFVKWYRTVYRILLARVRLKTTLSQFSRIRLIRAVGNAADDLVIVPCGVDHFFSVPPKPEFLENHGIKTGEYFLAVGSINPTKNFQRLLSSYSQRFLNGLPRLVVVGGMNSKVFRGAGLTTSEGIIYLGRVADDELKSLYENALAFVFPSIYEGFGIPPLEAMACGCPVIASEIASIPEVCGEAAGYFDPFSEESIGNQLMRVSTEPEWRAQLSRLGRVRASQFRWADSARAIAKLVRGAIGV